MRCDENYLKYLCTLFCKSKISFSPNQSELKQSNQTPLACSNKIGFETIYAVKYDANGGTGVLSAQIKTNGEDLILSDIIPTKEGYAFKGWATSSTANSATYQPGDIYSIDSDVTLYAIWQTAIKEDYHDRTNYKA